MTSVICVANWKMNPKTAEEAHTLLETTKQSAKCVRGIRIIIAPPSIFLQTLAEGRKTNSLAFAVQHAHFEENGAYTGDISLPQARNVGATYALIGHAERRAVGETNDDVRKKVATCLSLDITPIICIGEKVRSESGEHFGFIKEQLQSAYTHVPQKKIARTIVAYEPVWAIGGESAMQPKSMHEMSIFIRKCLSEMYAPISLTTFPKVLYGGAIDETNALTMLRLGDIHGFLVGRASTDVKKVSALMKEISKL